MATDVKQYPKCERHCKRTFAPGGTWRGANYCRLVYILAHIDANPGVTTAEIAQLTGMTYGDVTKAMAKGREREMFRLEPEERDQGGLRYHYYLPRDYSDILGEMMKILNTTFAVPATGEGF